MGHIYLGFWGVKGILGLTRGELGVMGMGMKLEEEEDRAGESGGRVSRGCEGYCD